VIAGAVAGIQPGLVSQDRGAAKIPVAIPPRRG
jgi:hypothetical protein